MIERIYERLAVLGYVDLSSMDKVLIESELERVQAYVQNFCNLKEIPIELIPRIVDEVCRLFLSLKKNAGQLNGFCYEQAVKSISEGDVSITFSDGESDAVRFEKLLSALALQDNELMAFRRLRW